MAKISIKSNLNKESFFHNSESDQKLENYENCFLY
jgi:hypothetical protein